MASIHGDVRDLKAIDRALGETKPEIIFHLAAQSLVRHSYREPVETYSTNLMGTVHLLDAVRRVQGVRAVVIVTSDKCYDNREWLWGYRENEAMGGRDPYSSSKGCAELITSAFRESFFPACNYPDHEVAIASARAGNVIGGGDWAEDRLIPDALRAFSTSQPLKIRHPGAIRPWQHVLEPLSGYLLLAESLCKRGVEVAEGWNFGPHEKDARTVGQVVESLCALWKSGASYVVDDASSMQEAGLLTLDCSKARSRLDWSPRWSLDMALARTVSWYRAHLDGEAMRNTTMAQIEEYTA